jgi:biofilm PGA synthesis protein PgaD
MNPKDGFAGAAIEAGSPEVRDGSADLSAAERSLLLEVAQRARTPLIIERPEGILSARKLTNYALTFLWWSVWGHFMLPLITLLLWMSGFRRFSEELLEGGGLDALVRRLPLYGAVIGVLCAALIIWALLNWWRFADRDRRRSFRPIPAAAIAHSYGLAPEDVARWQAMRRLVVQHDAHGRPTGVLQAQCAEPAHARL